MNTNIFCRTEHYSISEFLNDEHKTKSSNLDKLSYALFLPFNMQDPVNGLIEKPLVEYNFKHEIGTNTLNNFKQFNDTMKTFIEIIQDPSIILKNILMFFINISFPIAAIVSIIALCAYVFSGCQDKSPLKYVGMSVALMYVFNVIIVQFINIL